MIEQFRRWLEPWRETIGCCLNRIWQSWNPGSPALRSGFTGSVLMILCVNASSAVASQVQDEAKIELSGFSLSEAFRIEDQQAFELDQAQLLKLIYRLWQTSLVNLEKYSQYTRDVGWKKLMQDPPAYRLQVFETVGRARSVERIRLPNAEAGEDPRFVYRVQCQSDTGQLFELLSLRVPQVWLKAAEIDQPVSALGFFYATIESNTVGNGNQVAAPVPLFLAKQVSWKPTESNAELGIEPAQVWLAEQGVDLADLDLVRQEDRRPMGTADARSFYQFLKAVQTAPEPSMLSPLSHMDLLRNPSRSHGRLIGFRARVKKCSVVRPLTDAVNRSAGIESYFQLIVFPELRDSRDEPTMVEIGRDDQKLTYQRFPFTVCCRQLPAGMTSTSIENHQIWIDGFFFRFWLFEAERTTIAGAAGQISPIIIAKQPQLLQSSFGQLKDFFNSLLLIVFAVLAIVGWMVFRFSFRNRPIQDPLPEKLDIKTLNDVES